MKLRSCNSCKKVCEMSSKNAEKNVQRFLFFAKSVFEKNWVIFYAAEYDLSERSKYSCPGAFL